jgi:hypothetical protein
VQERDVERLQPSAFEGRDLSEDPLPADKILAWSVHWPAATLRDEPRPDAQDVGQLEYHVRLYVVGDPVDQPGTTFYRVDGDEERWVDGREIRRYLPFESPREVDANTSWVDVDLDQQVLTLMRGTTPIFVTLISSGGYKDPTPVGLFRISTKVAYDDMRSREGDDEPYHVEAVPWVQYFNGRYALHGTFWHNRFGLRTSHGCINLSAKDAARVFAATLPEPPAGWISVYEHPEDLGTLLRIRNGPREPPDRRRPPATRGTLGDEP